MKQYEALLACYRSGQMSVRQMQEHMRDDPAFAEYVKKQAAQTIEMIA